MIDEDTIKAVAAEALKHIGKSLGTVPCGVSNRHIHLTKADAGVLFGEGYELTPLAKLSQPGQFSSKETLILAGPKGCLEKVRIIGPYRKATQVEISRTDNFKLGINAPVRNSGDIAGSAGCIIIGPKGHIVLKEGVIVAARHIHLSPTEATQFGLKDKDVVSIRTGGERAVVFGNVLVRTGESHLRDFHLDTDEANAAGLKNGDIVEVIS